MQITREQARYLWSEECCEELGLVLQEEGDWSVDSKYQHISNIYFQEGTGKYFEMTMSRSGSPFTDWDYIYADSLNEVHLVSKTVIVNEWERK